MSDITITSDTISTVSTRNSLAGTRSVYFTFTMDGVDHRGHEVTMPDGEVRLFITRYNGYLADLFDNGTITADPRRFACAWSWMAGHTLKRGA